MKNTFILTLIILLIILFILSLFSYFTKQTTKEGFDVGDINKVVDKIDNVVKVAGEIPSKINGLSSQITSGVTNATNQIQQNVIGKFTELETTIQNQASSATNQLQQSVVGKFTELENTLEKKVTSMTNKVENVIGEAKDSVNQVKNELNQLDNKITNLVTVKIGSFFKQLGDIFEDGFVKPFKTLFESLGDIFIQLFNILKKIGYKIRSLPNCTIMYAIQSCINTFNAIYSAIMPDFLEKPLHLLYKYTLGIIVNFIAYIIGYNEYYEKCYGFNVEDEIDKMNKEAGDVRRAFIKGWGLDFSKIKI
jgi:archaellum component FlaC